MKTYVITGATSGIGKELLNLLKNEDCIIFAGYRDFKKLDKNLNNNIIPFYIDLKDRKSITKATEFIKEKTDKIDVLINVAGSVIAGPIEVLDTDKLREQFDINVFSHIEFSQNLISHLGNGRIVNISSMSSFGNFPFISPYCASKRALDIFFNALAIENHKNIKIISIKPGVIATPIWEKSVNANYETLCHCDEYKTEMEFLKNNALKNTDKGLNVKKAVKQIYKIINKKNPKSSYTIGKDAKFAQILSIFPQDIINCLIKFGIKTRIKKYNI